MTLYIYSGPQTALTLPDGRECILRTGASMELPEDNAAVATLCAMGRLSPAPAPVKPTPTKTKE